MIVLHERAGLSCFVRSIFLSLSRLDMGCGWWWLVGKRVGGREVVHGWWHNEIPFPAAGQLTCSCSSCCDPYKLPTELDN